jgi:hypothetical protein
MLVDFEPGHEPFRPGDVITPTLIWLRPGDMPPIPESVVTHKVSARLERNPNRSGA